MALKIYTMFHLNLAFSSLAEDKRAEVVARCYWPILRLAEEHGIPVGIEAPSWTLDEIARLDPSWIETYRSLLDAGRCEAIGAGFVQMIGPLAPPDVTRWNLRLGFDDYRRILGVAPRLALVNEQCYSAGIVPLYREAGFDGLIAEWESAFSGNPAWRLDWRYFPQRAVGVDGGSIPLVWNRSIAFQKVQRYAHGDLDLADVVTYALEQRGDEDRAFPLYGSDAEVFDFRPGRYKTEASIQDGEWQRIARLYDEIGAHADVDLVLPSAVLEMTGSPDADNPLRLETAEHPVPTKKQEKYNVTRWSVTGRGDFSLNTRCWRLYRALRDNATAAADAALWRQLCFVWSSDFRTHITDQRWDALKAHVGDLERRLGVQPKTAPAPAAARAAVPDAQIPPNGGRLLKCGNEDLSATFNTRKGLALDAFVDSRFGEQPLFGTLAHGHFDAIHLAADFFTGHLVFEAPGSPKFTDLQAVRPTLAVDGAVHSVAASMASGIGRIEKTWRLDTAGRSLALDYRISDMTPRIGSFRLGFVTLNAAAFDEDDLCFWTHNGGIGIERFPLVGTSVNHGRAVSSLVSANAGLGATEGIVAIGDGSRCVRIAFDKTSAALIALVHYERVHGKTFARVFFSAQEVDDTSRNLEPMEPDFAVTFTISAVPTAELAG